MKNIGNSALERSWLDLKRNCDYYFSRIIGYPLSLPEHVYFSSTGRCNLRCKMCNIPKPENRLRDELTTAEVKKVIDQIADLRINHLTFSGGEPLLREDIFDLVTYAVDRKIQIVDVITNGLLINAEVAQKLVSCGVTHITVSIDGLEEVNDFIRGKGSFKKAMRALDLINKYKNNNFPSTGINFTIMGCNINQLLPMIDLARDKRCNIIVFQPVLADNTNMQKRNKNELWVSKESIPRLKEVMKDVIKLKKTMQGLTIHVNDKILEMVTDYFSEQPLNNNLQCYESIVRIVISHNGDLWTCKGIYGNSRRELLRKQWISYKAKKIRQEIRQCQNHCLQSCIYLAELSDVYSDIIKFKTSIGKDKGNQEYLRRLSLLLEGYKFLLARKLTKYSRNIHADKKAGFSSELKLEIEKISGITENLI